MKREADSAGGEKAQRFNAPKLFEQKWSMTIEIVGFETPWLAVG